MARLVVQKYGGSSLADAERIRHVAGRIARDRRQGNDLVVVVSAMGDTTDHLIALAAAITDQPDPREMDLLLATGEHMSGTLVAMALHAIGVDAISLTGPQAGIRTDRTHGRARIANIEPARVRTELQHGRVVIVAGFQGSTDETFLSGEVTTLGRGGSDTTAVALAASLAADSCEIYTDVEGIYTADPRIVPDARLIEEIGYEEMLELAHQGAQVMQTRAVELGWVNGVVIRVRSTFSDHPGTTITEVTDMELRDKVRGMAFDRKVAKVTLVGVPDRPGIARSIFEPLADQGINVDVIVQNVGHEGTTDMSFTVNEVDLGRAERLLDLLVRDLGFAGIATDAKVAKISIVGAGIQNAPGYAARMFGALADAGINILMISTSEIRITCIIAEADLDAAAAAIHRTFRLEASSSAPEAAEPAGAASQARFPVR
jgi:aspartate kinase